MMGQAISFITAASVDTAGCVNHSFAGVTDLIFSSTPPIMH